VCPVTVGVVDPATDSYAETAVSAGGADLLVCNWSRTTAAGAAKTYRIVPDGCVDLIWTGARLFVAGPDTRAQPSTVEPGTLVGVRFRPGVASALLGVPADAIRDERFALAETVPNAGRQAFAHRLADQLSAAASPKAAGELLERTVLDNVRRDLLDPTVSAMLSGLRAGVPVGQLAERLGLTERGMHRRCLAAFGYGPKLLQRVLRFQHALRLVRSGRLYADAAIETGYADQPHLAREVRALAGVPLGVLLND
jgi:AraC-like DNA-binding protein